MKKLFALVLAVLALAPAALQCAPRFSRGTAIPGVLAYQDSDDPTQFWYIPTSIPVVLGGSLENFGVKYWGVARPFLVEKNGFYRSIIGATLSGRAHMDINAHQRQALIAELKAAYGVAAPKLLPMPLKDTEVTPVLASSTLGLTDKTSDVVFPKVVAIPSPFSFVVGSGDNRLFAQYVGAQANGAQVIADPSFAVNVVGQAEFQGDPWINKCSADLSQVWNKVRSSVSVSVGWGWFRLGSASYSSIVQDLTRTGVIKCDWKEGSLDTEKYGRQILELGKEAFQALNAKASSGEGFFKFEPNPEPSEIGSGAAGWWPWTVSVNGGYSEAHFTQSIHWENEIKYTGRFWWPVPISMVLAVRCNSATADHFVELGESVACITQEKADALNVRVAREAAAKNKRLKQLLDRYLAGEITQEQYERAVAALGSVMLTEDSFSPSPMRLDSEDKRTLRTGFSEQEVDSLINKAISSGSSKHQSPVSQ